MKALVASLTILISIAHAMAADTPSSVTQVRGKILMADCSRTLIEASSRDMKDMCVVIYSGVFTGEGKDGALWSNDVEGNIGFAKESSGVLNFVGKHAEINVDLSNGQIKSVQAPE